LGLALVLRIHAAFGSIEDDEVLAMKADAGMPRSKRSRSSDPDSSDPDGGDPA
jgi:hypothetical protein